MLLPDLDGLTVREVLRRQASTRETPIILITAITAEATQCAAKIAGARALLEKPLDFEKLKTQLNAAFAGPAAKPETDRA